MVSLQTKLNLKVTQRQILTPGLVQMVSVLALNKLELKDMINEEMVENPVLDEYLEPVPTIDEIAARRSSASAKAPPPPWKSSQDHPGGARPVRGSRFRLLLQRLPGPWLPQQQRAGVDRKAFV